ncbi:hypothetical protein M5362_14955 [Streptomyces sp. Je 1-79]|uniref:hypothetical protein n=1 Tax=Streptomyces sp. Je 1-79 TaxID=2943847 RepID=UPI0021A51C49|nr:hypothetical protein [Streptomyces sp. Je 1-79]MCT4354429.1 hypothetical protein [Streptomyces sp. Je 1-79]
MGTLLYVTDLGYQARGRRYCDEDIWLSGRLREEFGIALCHPLDAAALMDRFDGVVVRNSGPVLHYQEAYDAFTRAAREGGVRVFNSLSGKGDMAGKDYLLQLSREGFPVIPTAGRREEFAGLPEADEYVVKPLLGADSVGLRFVERAALGDVDPAGMLVQPRIPFAYEVSFYFVGRAFQYALYAPDPEARWKLERYEPTTADLDFARRFVDWNGLEYGIQRVDACRAPGGELLLVELEDLNPYLSLDLVGEKEREAFVTAMKGSLRETLAG